MKLAAFSARCPFEIGDRILNGNTGRTHIITDICCIHFLKSGSVEFQYELDNSGRYIAIGGEGK